MTDETRKLSITRQSIEPTYDSRETGPRYFVSSRVDGRPVVHMERVSDPFVAHTVYVGWRDLLRGLLRRRLTVEVIVGGDRSAVDDVLELDANTLVPGSTRRIAFNAEISKAIVRHVKAEEAAADDTSPSSTSGDSGGDQ